MKCIFDRNDILNAIEMDANKAGEIAAGINTIKAELLPTLTARQKELFRQFDDAAVTEGTARVNAALKAVCRCPACHPVTRKKSGHRVHAPAPSVQARVSF